MTNLIVSIIVAVVTNVSDSYPVSYPNGHPIPCPSGISGCCVYHYDRGAPVYDYNDHTRTWTVGTQKVLNLDWEGQLLSYTNFIPTTNWSRRKVARISNTTNWMEAPIPEVYQSVTNEQILVLPPSKLKEGEVEELKKKVFLSLFLILYLKK